MEDREQGSFNQKELLRRFLLSAGNSKEKFNLEINLQTGKVTLKNNVRKGEKNNQPPKTCNAAAVIFPSDPNSTINSTAHIIFPKSNAQLFFPRAEQKERCRKICQALTDVPDAYSIFRENVPNGTTILLSQIRHTLQLGEDDDEPEEHSKEEEEITYEDFLLYYHQVKHGGNEDLILEENEDTGPSPRIFSNSIVERPGVLSPNVAKALLTEQKPITDPKLFGGEQTFLGPQACCLGINMQEGFLWLTDYRVVFVHQETHNSIHIPLTLMLRIHKDANSVTLQLYDNRDLRFTFGYKRKDSQTIDVNAKWVDGFYLHIMRMAFPGPKSGPKDREKVFAYSYKPEIKIEEDQNGWNFYDPEAEFERLGLIKNKKLRITKINATYALCPSYPKKICCSKDNNR